MKKLKWRSFFSCVLVMTILMSIPAYNISVSAYEDNELNSETNIRDKIENILDISLNWMNDQKFDDGSFGDNTIIMIPAMVLKLYYMVIIMLKIQFHG